MRNKDVEAAVILLVDSVDHTSNGVVLGAPPSTSVKQLFDEHVQAYGGSVRLACAFFVAYSVVNPGWDFQAVPVGIRGAHGDKKLAGELTRRNVTFHKAITAFGENLGWKGAVRQFDLSQDDRFSSFLSGLKGLTVEARRSLLHHVAWVLSSSRTIPQALPALPDDYLSYARSLALSQQLLALPSEGHIQQLLVAAFLEVHRRRYSHRVITHHPHASDRFDNTKGDIEEFRDYELVAAYEVTVRADWKNRLQDFGKKVSEAKLHKYVIFAAGVNSDPHLRPAERLLEFSASLPFDLAIVDIQDFFAVFCAELTRVELSAAFNRTYAMLCDPKLSGRPDFITKFKVAMDRWLEVPIGRAASDL